MNLYLMLIQHHQAQSFDLSKQEVILLVLCRGGLRFQLFKMPVTHFIGLSRLTFQPSRGFLEGALLQPCLEIAFFQLTGKTIAVFQDTGYLRESTLSIQNYHCLLCQEKVWGFHCNYKATDFMKVSTVNT